MQAKHDCSTALIIYASLSVKWLAKLSGLVNIADTNRGGDCSQFGLACKLYVNMCAAMCYAVLILVPLYKLHVAILHRSVHQFGDTHVPIPC